MEIAEKKLLADKYLEQHNLPRVISKDYARYYADLCVNVERERIKAFLEREWKCTCDIAWTSRNKIDSRCEYHNVVKYILNELEE
jgi:hypothetical protein